MFRSKNYHPGEKSALGSLFVFEKTKKVLLVLAPFCTSSMSYNIIKQLSRGPRLSRFQLTLWLARLIHPFIPYQDNWNLSEKYEKDTKIQSTFLSPLLSISACEINGKPQMEKNSYFFFLHQGHQFGSSRKLLPFYKSAFRVHSKCM